MTYCIEIFYAGPMDERREQRITRCAVGRGGRLDYREAPATPAGPVCLTYEFDDAGEAESAAGCLRAEADLHVEGPSAYGGDDVPAEDAARDRQAAFPGPE